MGYNSSGLLPACLGTMLLFLLQLFYLQRNKSITVQRQNKETSFLTLSNIDVIFLSYGKIIDDILSHTEPSQQTLHNTEKCVQFFECWSQFAELGNNRWSNTSSQVLPMNIHFGTVKRKECRLKSIKRIRTTIVWLKSAGFESFMRSAKPNVITHTSLGLPPNIPTPFPLSFYSSLDLSLSPEIFMRGSEKWMLLPKGAEVEEREVSRFDRYSLMMKVTEGLSQLLQEMWMAWVMVALCMVVYRLLSCMCVFACDDHVRKSK